jgi:hypothetical protein
MTRLRFGFALGLVAFSLALLPGTATAALRVTEIVAVNTSGLSDEDGTFQDWVELHNDGAEAANLDGFYLTDSASSLKKWKLPAVTLPAGGYLVVFASDKNRANPLSVLHTNFKLSSDGEYLALVAPDGTTVVHDYAPAFLPVAPNSSFGLASDLSTRRCFAVPTPGAANDDASSCGRVALPSFSSERGFYDAPFALTLHSSTPGATIVYTTDGSAPSETHGETYTGPIPISGTTMLRASAFAAGLQASASVTHSYLFLDDVLAQPKNAGPDTWATDYEMDPDVVADPFYGALIRSSLLALPTLSIVMDENDLFGDTDGIYNHPNKRGDEWERPASSELLRHDGVDGFQANCGVRIQGDVSRLMNKKKSFRLHFKTAYGPAQLDYPFFRGSPVDSFKRIRLRAGHQESWSYGSRSATYVRDQWARDTQLAMGRLSSRGNFVHLYLNGLYWGVYNAVERPDKDFAAAHLGGNTADWDVLKHGPEIVDGDDLAWKEAHALARQGLSSPEAYAAIQQLVDVPNLIDYFLTNLYAGTTDWDANNYYVVRRRSPGSGFQFLSWDTETSLKSINDNRVNIAIANKPSGLYSALRANSEFRVLFGDHVQKHLFAGGALTPEAAWERFRARTEEIRGALVAESARWGDTMVTTPILRDRDWLVEVERLRLQYFPRRGANFLESLRAVGLFPTTVAPTFSRHGGLVPAGFELAMTAPDGEILYTLDGSDPRLPGGGVAPGALPYSAPLVLNGTTRVKARTKKGADWSAASDAVFTPDRGLRLTELHYHPADPPPGDPRSADDFEFVELKNTGSESIELLGTRLASGITFTFGTRSLAPGEHVLVVRNPTAFQARYGAGLPVAGSYGGSLRNSGERLRLEDADGGVLHDFVYDDRWHPSTDGHGPSLVVRDELADPSAWAGSAGWRPSATSGGSPGASDLPVCSDSVDNDLDGLVDLDDPGCADASSSTEEPQCQDSSDNDGDGFADEDDPDCPDPSRDDETIDLVDSFACYSTIVATSPLSRTVTLTDEVVGPRSTTLGKARALCVPSSVAGSAVEDSATQLQLYEARDASGLAVPSAAKLQYTALGPIVLDRSTPDRLLVPTTMDSEGPATAPEDGAHRLDRYRCYRASTSKGSPRFLPRGTLVTMSNAHEQDRAYEVRHLARLCLPTAIDDGSVREDRGGFLCYGVRLARGQARVPLPAGVFVADEFWSTRLDFRSVSEICIPLR